MGLITREDVLRIAALARLRLGEEEVARFAVELDGILEHVDVLRELEAEEDEAADGAPAVAWGAPLRPDEPGPDPLLRPLAAFVHGLEEGLITVPRLASHQGEEETGP